MNVLTNVSSDVGIKKTTNQDSSCVMVAETSLGTVVMAMVCDGMGGLARGELASATVIREFCRWFEQDLPRELKYSSMDKIAMTWKNMVNELNARIGEYGREHTIQLGTTMTVFLVIERLGAIFGHVGDSRLYQISDGIQVLTEDQTVVARDVRRGIITEEQARTDARRNVLLQCIGVAPQVVPQVLEVEIRRGNVYMLCSDGFRHEISEDEILQAFTPTRLTTQEKMKEASESLIWLNEQRGESDNITVVLLKIE